MSPSLITSGGFCWLLKSITTGTDIHLTWIGYGSASDTALTSSVSLSSLGTGAMSAAQISYDNFATSATASWTATMVADTTLAISEAGLFTGATAASGTTMVMYGSHSEVPMEANDSIEYTFTLRFM